MRRFDVISDGTPDGDRAAAVAQKMLDAIPDGYWRTMTREAARLAAQGSITGVYPTPAEMRQRLEEVARDYLHRSAEHPGDG